MSENRISHGEENCASSECPEHGTEFRLRAGDRVRMTPLALERGLTRQTKVTTGVVHHVNKRRPGYVFVTLEGHKGPVLYSMAFWELA